MQRPRLLIEQLRYFSLFSGIGGFELGMYRSSTQNMATQNESRCTEKTEQTIRVQEGQSGKLSNRNPIRLTCIGFSEIDKYATQIYKTHFNHKEYGNVSTINWPNTENFDLLVGGFPCQAFSIAGKRQGFGDTRGTLFFEIARCLKEKQPRLLLLENVKGLLSHGKGQTFGIILNTLDELGYDLQWQVLNSKNFGVPQNRERVFIVGHLRGTSRPQVFPINGFRMGKTHPAVCLTQRGYKSQRNGTYVESHPKTMIHSRPHGFNKGGIRTTVNVRNSAIQNELIIRDGRDNRSCLRSCLRSGRVPELGIPGISIRRLTPTECERLQGFPDGWTEGISDTQRYKCLGNAVTVNVIEAIITNLLK